ncbi:hypothetical protein REC12_18780 [Desulfosporosinus sp. PR]|uniref:RipA family octameric membrane protein n=1 Tax=Candidatus Desulfosporosinus nitrosoreducens TaxID=3401928 RepID=UPI0027F4635F|nr:hypothetical protein [Desulfosporosinus sp. PR]MDQ7095639.1 hypothetical protein [Desulfosporosinus sp. PR]
MSNRNHRGGILLNTSAQKYGEKFRDHYFEQYKLYLEMTDRVSARRVLANAFFLTLHTSLIALLGVLYKEGLKEPRFWMLIPLIGIELLCYSWWAIVRSYRMLNKGRFKVIHKMEINLPCSPYKIEWDVLGRGKDPKRYRPITHVENWIPILFGLMYFILGCVLIYNLVKF